MYLEDACTIKKTSDGKFVVAIPHREEAKETKSNEVRVDPEPKTYVAADMDELVGILKEYLPVKKSESDKFKKGFSKK